MENQIAQPDPEVSFKRKTESDSAGHNANVVSLTEEEKGYIQFMRGIAESFEDEEILILTHIIAKLEEDVSRLRTVAELLGIKVEELLQAVKSEQ